ncbi:MAG: CoA transferase [Cellvibrionales bacterium]|nr:CoA transferase [Cellvibrionales bacterium]
MGPLAGLTVIEIKALGPAPYAAMLLADLGAEVVVVSNPAVPPAVPAERDIACRGKRSVALDLKSEAGLAALLALIERADVLIEGFRPGVAERLGFGPEVCHKRNPRLVYGRMTGWGQDGPLAQRAAHDINFIALTGAQAAIGTAEQPVPPLNLVGDFGGGSMFLVMGILAALYEVRESGQGQVVDAAITDGVASLMSIVHTLHGLGAWSVRRERNIMDGAAPNYGVYATADGKHVAVGPIEPPFYRLLLEKLGLDPAMVKAVRDPANWPAQREALAAAFKSKTRAEWDAVFEGSDACYAPVLDIEEAPEHPHNRARGTYIEVGGQVQPAPAPRFSRSVPLQPAASVAEGSDTAAVLAEFGLDEATVRAVLEGNAVLSKKS